MTWGDLCNTVRLSVPNAPPFLIQRWLKRVMNDLADRRQWSWQLVQGQLTWGDSRVFTATVTIGSATVTSAAQFVAGDVGRSFAVGTYPLYTIIGFTDASTVTLDMPYYGTTSGSVDDASILDAYAVMPANFENFVAILDPTNQRMVPWWGTQMEMDTIDPVRMATGGTPRLLCSASPSVDPATLGQTRYEYYPKPNAIGALQYYAKLLPFTLALDEDLPIGIAARADILELGALMHAAKWPGTVDLKNPYFNIGLAQSLRGDYESGCQQLDIRDDDRYQQSIDNLPWQRWSAWGWAYDTHFLQSTDATVGAYFGYLGAGWGR
jgi:hypothetical protein